MKRIDKRRVVATIVIAAVVLQAGFAAVAFFARRSAEESLRTECVRRDELDVRVQMAEHTDAPDPAAGTERIEWALEESPDVSGALQVIQGIGDRFGVELSTLKASKSTTDGKQTFQISGVATPAKICEFVAGVERHQLLVVVETGRILPATSTEVVFDLGLATYHARKEAEK